ncbi:MAG: DUF4124 domain-containing protein [Gammaproteobacteria bacterium]
MKQLVNLIDTCRALSGLLLGAALLLAAPASAEDIYKWIGDDNQVHYTQMPPPHGIEAILMQRSDVPADEEPGEAAEMTDEPEQAVFDDTSSEPSEAAGDEGDADADGDAKTAQALRENCSNARKNLASLNRGQVRYVNPDGEIIRLTEEERQQRIEEAKAQIGVLCEN